MKKTINIEGQPIEISSNQGWLFCYKEEFGHDILPDLLPMLEAVLGALAELYEGEEDLSYQDIFAKLDDDVVSKAIISLSTLEVLTVHNILWAMAKNAGETRNPRDFANSFDVFPYDEILPELFTTIIKSSMSSKNSESLLKNIPSLSRLTQSSSPEQDED